MIIIISKLWKPVPVVQRECANQPELLQWEQVSNTIRPNQDLRYLTLQQNLEKYYKKVMCH